MRTQLYQVNLWSELEHQFSWVVWGQNQMKDTDFLPAAMRKTSAAFLSKPWRKNALLLALLYHSWIEERNKPQISPGFSQDNEDRDKGVAQTLIWFGYLHGHDVSTLQPFLWSRSVRTTLSRSRDLSWIGTSHSASRFIESLGNSASNTVDIDPRDFCVFALDPDMLVAPLVSDIEERSSKALNQKANSFRCGLPNMQLVQC